MSELATAKTLDLGIVPTGTCLRVKPPILGSKRSVPLWFSGSIHPSGYRAHLIPHLASQREHLLQCRLTGRFRSSSAGPWGTITHSKHSLRFAVLFSARSLHRLMHSESLFRRPVSVCGRCQTGEICTNFNKSLEFLVLLGPDHYPKILLELRIRLPSHELFGDQLLSQLRWALWVSHPARTRTQRERLRKRRHPRGDDETDREIWIGTLTPLKLDQTGRITV